MAAIVRSVMTMETRGAHASDVRAAFVQLGKSVPAVLYEPARPDARAAVGLVIMHPFGSSLRNTFCLELSARGYTVLGADPRTTNLMRQEYFIDDQAADLALAIRFLRQQPGIRKVVLAGHSAGGPLASFYQTIAENGVTIGQDSAKLVPCSDDLSTIPAADGLILLDSHAGYGFLTLTYVDPSIVDEADPSIRDASLDMYDPENGYAATGATYSPDFVDRYVTAQGERHRRLMALARDRMTLIESGDGSYPDDEPFLVHGVNARIWMPDLRLLGRTRGAYPVLRRDGSMETEVAHSTRPPSGSAQVSRSYASAITGVSVRQFLSSHSVSTTSEYAIGEDEIRGIKWATSNTSTPSNLAGVTTPLLIAAMGAHYFLVPSEIAYEHAASQDKQLVIIEGANHFFMPCEATEPTPGAWGDTVKTLFDYVDGWVAERFV